jgi:hypothetical protein
MTKPWNMLKQDFVTKATSIHGGRYSYSDIPDLVNSSRTKITVRCPEHNLFNQTAYLHLKGHGCGRCARKVKAVENIGIIQGLNLTTAEFVHRSSSIHENKYSYEKSVYKSQKDKVIVSCPAHGDFLTNPANHMRGHGCAKCYHAGRKVLPFTPEPSFRRGHHFNAISTFEFIKRSRERHGDRYEYTNTQYVRQSAKVEIVCSLHGPFWQRPSHHYNGFGCRRCCNLARRKI